MVQQRAREGLSQAVSATALARRQLAGWLRQQRLLERFWRSGVRAGKGGNGMEDISDLARGCCA